MTKLRVAIVAPSLNILGGEAVQAERLVRSWREDPNVTVWLVPIDPPVFRPFRTLANIRYVRALVSEIGYLSSLARQMWQADVVHVFSRSYVWFVLAPLPALVLGRLLGRRVLLHYHNGEAFDHLSRSAVARAALGWADLVVVPSTYLRDVLRSFGVDPIIVPNAADLRSFQYRVRDPLRPRLLSTRNLHKLYNVECTLRAFQIIQQRRPDATLTLVGRGSNERALRELTIPLGLRNVAFVGQVKHEAIGGYYADHDVYVQSPTVDNVSNSVIEAFASGLPVVSTEVGGVSTILTHEKHGLLVPPNDHNALAAAVMRLLEHPTLARRLAGAAHATCGAYGWPGLRQEWLGLYRRLSSGSTMRDVVRVAGEAS